MKLELKHLAPYLPYELKGYNRFMGHNLITDIDCANVMNYVFGDTNSKPLLRPLSDLTKEIEHNGERFFVINKFSDMRSREHICEHRRERAFEALKRDIQLKRLQYDFMQKLFEWHFDVFGLIEAGLAIDKNTLNS